MEVMRFLGRKLRDLRERKGLTQTRLANRAGVPQVTVWRLENDKLHNVSVVVVRRLAKALGVGVDTLVGTDDPDVDAVPAELTLLRG